MRKLVLTIALIFAILSIAFAGSTPKGNADKGRNQFRQTCKNCHTKGAAGGEVTPLNKTAAQWRAYFETGKHARGTLSQVMPEQQLRDVQAYLVAHAIDSEQPEVCGR